MTLLAFAAQLTAAILYSSAVCTVYCTITVQYRTTTVHSTAAALLEHLDLARDIE